MPEKQHRQKTPRGQARVSRTAGIPSQAKSGRYVIVKPKKPKANTLVAELARQGLFVAAPRGVSLTAIEKKLEAVARRTMPLSTAKAPVKAKSEPEPRARLVGTPLTRSGKARSFPYATPGQVDAVIDMAETLSSDEIASRLNTNRETIKQWRAAGRVIGVEGAKRGVRYPIAQIGPNLSLLPGIREVLEDMEGDHWEAWRFLAGEIDELDNETGFNALRAGRLQEVLQVLKSRSYGSFS